MKIYQLENIRTRQTVTITAKNEEVAVIKAYIMSLGWDIQDVAIR